MLDRSAEPFGQEGSGQRAVGLCPVQGNPERPVRGRDGPAAHKPIRIDHVDHGRLHHVEKRCVEKGPRQHFVICHGLGDMVDAGQADAGCRLVVGQEFDIPDIRQVPVVDKVHHAAAEPADRRDGQFTWTERLGERLSAERSRAGDCV